jgi:hypothetical protein
MARWLNPEYALVQTSRKLVRWLRRVGTRIFLVDLHTELEELRARQDRLERQLGALQGRAYDQSALSRRLAALEDHLRELGAGQAGSDALPRKG